MCTHRHRIGDFLKIAEISGLGPPKIEMRAEKAPNTVPLGGQRGANTIPNEVQEGLEIQLVSKGGPKWLRWPLEAAFLDHLG